MGDPKSPFQSSVLQGKVALITGGSSGIGLEITRQLGLHGAAVAITGRRQEALQSAEASLRAEGIQALGIQGDVRKPEDCERWVKETVARFGRLDILVNCAAGNFLAPAEELTPNAFRTVMEIDTFGTFHASRAAFPELRKSGDALIINISMVLHYTATWFMIHASAAKAAIDSMTRSLSLEWGEYGIRTNGVAPGSVAGTIGFAKLGGGAAEAAAAAKVPLQKLAAKWDIAMACVFLATPGARYINGDTIVVDGGERYWRDPVVPRKVVSRWSAGIEKESRTKGAAALAQARSKL